VAADEPPPPAPAATLIQTEVDEDAIEPSRELCVAAKRPRGAIDAQKGLLREVARVLGVPQQGPRQAVRAALVAGDQDVERRLVPRRDTPAQRLIGGDEGNPLRVPLPNGCLLAQSAL